MESLAPHARTALWRAVAKVLRHERQGSWMSLEELCAALICAKRYELTPAHVEDALRAGGRLYELREGPTCLEVRSASAEAGEEGLQSPPLRRVLTLLLRYHMPGWQRAAVVTQACAARLGRPISLERVLDALHADERRFEVARWRGDTWVRACYSYAAGQRVDCTTNAAAHENDAAGTLGAQLPARLRGSE